MGIRGSVPLAKKDSYSLEREEIEVSDISNKECFELIMSKLAAFGKKVDGPSLE